MGSDCIVDEALESVLRVTIMVWANFDAPVAYGIVCFVERANRDGSNTSDCSQGVFITAMSREGFHTRRNTNGIVQAFFQWRLGDAEVTPTEAVIDSATGVVLDAVFTVEALE